MKTDERPNTVERYTCQFYVSVKMFKSADRPNTVVSVTCEVLLAVRPGGLMEYFLVIGGSRNHCTD